MGKDGCGGSSLDDDKKSKREIAELQAKLNVAIEAFEFMIDSWMSGTVTQYEIRKRAEEALEKLK